MEQILVPTDFSSCSENATKAGIELASRMEGEMTFLHLIDIPVESIISPGKENDNHPQILETVDKTTKKLNKYIDLARSRRVLAEKHIHFNKSYADLVSYIKANDIYLVVMGSHGATGKKELLMGSNAQMVVRHSPAPVFVVKENTTLYDFKNILYVSDFNEYPAMGFKRIAEIAFKTGMKIQLLYINVQKKFQKSTVIFDRMREFTKSYKELIGGTHIYNAYSIEEGIRDYCENNPQDVLAVITHYRHGVRKWLDKSLSEKLVNHLDIPILVAHD